MKNSSENNTKSAFERSAEHQIMRTREVLAAQGAQEIEVSSRSAA